MRINDLRKGVYYNDTRINKIFRVESFYDNAINHGDQDYSCTLIKDAKGIPLNEEWLLSFGFKEIIIKPSSLCPYPQKTGEYCKYMFDNKGFIVVAFRDNGVFVLLDDHLCYLKKEIFVHDIQNLWFAISGKELNRKV